MDNLIWKVVGKFCIFAAIMTNTTTTTTTTTTPKIFVTDYASYNNGRQFEFGHWLELDQFADAAGFWEYINDHFRECDEKSPLDSPREELMITDFEGFPNELYSESMSSQDFNNLFDYLDLDEDNKIKVCFILEDGQNFDYAIQKYENVYLTEDLKNARYELFEMHYPEIEEISNTCDYLEINYDRFISENFTQFKFEGVYYLVNDSWNN